MSLVASRISLIHRCSVLRNLGSADAWGNQGDDFQPHLTDQECRVWSAAGREVAKDIEILTVEDRRLILPLGTDVTEDDLIGDVTYRGAIVYEGNMVIDAVLHNADHLELVLKRVR